MDFLAELNKIEKMSQEGKIQKAKLEERLHQLQIEQTKLLEELKKIGVSEAELNTTISRLEEDIEIEIQKANEILK